MVFTFSPHEIDQTVQQKALAQSRQQKIRLPLYAELMDPVRHLHDQQDALARLDPNAADPRNLLRVHWHNAGQGSALVDVPDHIVLPSSLTGVEAKIIVALGNRFPMIGAHKVLPAYGCLVQRLVTGHFDPEHHRAVWPSTGNYCRGGIAISRILNCHGVAVLPEGMSRERFQWLEDWVLDPSDIVRTPGTESNVKEIYDACHALSQDPRNVILNQFSEFGNYTIHRAVTGAALARIFEAVKGETALRLKGFVSASGSAGTLAAGDHLKQLYRSPIAVVEAVECPTLLYNGYGEHNIQGIGDKHVPLIHNVMNTDYVIGVSEAGPDTVNLLFNTEPGRRFLAKYHGIEEGVLQSLSALGLSALANILAAIKLAKFQKLGPEDAILTLATDGSELYVTERGKAMEKYFQGHFDEILAAQTYGTFVAGAVTDHVQELGLRDRERIFNLGYYTWVEQQGVSVSDFDRRRDQGFWDGFMADLPHWDALIRRFNGD